MTRNRKLILWAVALAFCFAGIYSLTAAKPDKGKPNIIVITLDSLRPDHMGCYGYFRDTSPNIDRLARTSDQYLNCYSAATWTLPANYSLITSKYLWQHRVYLWNSRFDKNTPNLFSLLKGRGYARGVFTNSKLIYKNFRINFPGAFEFSFYQDAVPVTHKALQWMLSSPAPFFAWIYYHEPHRPYYSPVGNIYPYNKGLQLPIKPPDPDYDGGWDYIPSYIADKDINDVNHYIALYDSSIHYADGEVGKLLSGLKDSGLFDNALIILTSDHGESLGEHHLFFNHIYTLFDEILKVPLVVKMPGQTQGRKIREDSGVMDILPTVLKYAGVKECPGCEGVPLDNRALPGNRRFYSFMSEHMYCLIDAGWKLISYPAQGERNSILHDDDFKPAKAPVPENANSYIRNFFPSYGREFYQLFDRRTDPAELCDVKESNQAKIKEMLLMISRKKQGMSRAVDSREVSVLSEQEKAELRSLGYAQ